MELKIYSPVEHKEDGFIKKISWNHEEIKKEVTEKVSYYTNLVYTDEQIKEAKADRAKLNKFANVLDDKRKEIKKQCLAPYNDFEEKIKEIVAVVMEPIGMIDKQVKEYEEEKRQEKYKTIKEYWDAKELPFPIELDRVLDKKWLNASTSLKSVHSAIDSIISTVEKDLVTLLDLPEFSFEAVEVYKSTLSVSNAIQEGRRLSDIQKRKLESEKQKELMLKAQLEEIRTLEDAEERCENAAENIENAAKTQRREWIGFKALLTAEDAIELKNFFNSRSIAFEPIDIR